MLTPCFFPGPLIIFVIPIALLYFVYITTRIAGTEGFIMAMITVFLFGFLIFLLHLWLSS